MARKRTGTVTDGIVLVDDGDTWVVGRADTVSNDGVSFDFNDTENRLVVRGTVLSTADAAIDARAFASARIFIDAGGVVDGTSGIFGGGWYTSPSTIRNDGEIHGGIVFEEAELRLQNNGTIDRADIGVRLPNLGSGGGHGTLVNTGTIVGDWIGVTGGEMIVNHGTIEGGDCAISNFGGDGAVVRNFGTFLGGVAGYSEVFNAGVILGDVHLGENGRYIARAGAHLNGVVVNDYGGPSAMIGNEHTDHFIGGVDADILNGRGGNDLLRGNEGGDRIAGGSGDDTINCGAGDDLVDGGVGDDLIIALSDSDVLAGGSGRDQFVWKLKGWPHTPSDSTILDFEDGVDTLVLSQRQFKTVDDVLEHAVNVGGDLKITGYNYVVQTIVLNGVSKSELADDILIL